MIITKLIGGLGNQMFQYAAGKSLAIKKGVELRVDLSHLKKNASGLYTQRDYELNVFKLNVAEATAEEISIFENLNSSKWKRLLQRNMPNMFSKTFFSEAGNHYHPAFETLPKQVYLDGFWQSEKYFQSIRTILLQDFELKNELSKHVQLLQDKIKNANSVSLHIRRGDYVNLPSANEFHGLCSIDYYQAAEKMLQDKIGVFEFFVFSDDMKWCKENLKFNSDVNFVEHGEAACIDMHLMRTCKHNVIANSSFSWWGAWLNENINKLVVAPEYWFKTMKSTDSDILPVNWITLKS